MTYTSFSYKIFLDCGYRIMAFISAFQAEDGGSIPPTRSKNKEQLDRVVFCFFWYVKEGESKSDERL